MKIIVFLDDSECKTTYMCNTVSTSCSWKVVHHIFLYTGGPHWPKKFKNPWSIHTCIELKFINATFTFYLTLNLGSATFVIEPQVACKIIIRGTMLLISHLNEIQVATLHNGGNQGIYQQILLEYRYV